MNFVQLRIFWEKENRVINLIVTEGTMQISKEYKILLKLYYF